MAIQPSELILNPDGSVYHLNLKPENIAHNIIFVGDQNRVPKVSKHFDSIRFKTEKREFVTHTGSYKGKEITVISTGIGPDNIDIVMNELDALVNIDLETRLPKENLTSLNIVRVGTSGALHQDVPVDAFVLSSFGLDINGMLHSYKTESIQHPDIEDAFIKHTRWDENKARPLIVKNSSLLENKFESALTHKGLTITAGGFYGPQGRVLRLKLRDPELINKIASFSFKGIHSTNFEMETSAIYGLSQLLGHHALSLNAIIANRASGTFSADPGQTIENLITYTLDRF
ncbi:nucleoside phosphorylase [Gaetbulibacter aestuarii]|uniref:Uridine phosphorylase n=1 Tax=Gaetbulibacter aestuarii TaxID=1502358 RepID=A0ABW7N0L8_9FLAO